MLARWLIAVATAWAVAALAAPSARAGELIDAAAAGLQSDPVYVDSGADPGLGAVDEARVRAAITRADAPLYVAVLREEALYEAGGSAEEVLRLLAQRLGRSGTYAVVVGGRFRAGSTVLPPGTAPRAADEAFQAHAGEGVAATLIGFVDRVGGRGQGAGGGGQGGGGASLLPLLLLVLLPLGAMLLLFRRRRAAGPAEPAFDEVRRAAEEELLALADDIRALDLDVQMPSASAEAKADYERALGAYERADAALDRARRSDDVEAVTSAVEEGRYWIAATQARLEHREPPERRPPCFFDPRHGPSVRDVEWAPPGGTPRPVPACAADAVRVEDGDQPGFREVPVGGRRVPYWEAPPSYGPWAGGFFGGGVLPGILLGSVLGSGMTVGHGPVVVDPDHGDFGDGDFGGGDFGGGDIGGGDFS